MHTRLFGITHLYAALPPWALGADDLGALLQDDGARERDAPAPQHPQRRRRLVARSSLFDNPFWPEYARRDIAAIAAERGQAPLDAVYDLLVPAVEEPHKLMVIIHAYDEDEQREAFAHPCCVPGSDATTLAPDGPLAESFFHGAYTWASWFWRFMVREERLLTPPRPCTS